MTDAAPVISDLSITTAVARWEGEMDVAVYRSRDDV